MNYVVWSFRIKNTVYKNVRPLTLELKREFVEELVSKFLFIEKYKRNYTNRYYIKMKYDRGPGTQPRIDRIFFDSYKEAEPWFNSLIDQVFCVKDPTEEKKQQGRIQTTSRPKSKPKGNRPRLYVVEQDT